MRPPLVSIRLKLIESFKRLPMPVRILMIVLASPLLIASALLALGVSTWLTAIFALPIIGWAVSRNSWKAGMRSSDKKVYFSFALSVVATVVVLLVLRQPQFRTDWEGGNPLDDLIALLWLSTLVALASTWYLVGWVGHRASMLLKVRKNRRVPAPD